MATEPKPKITHDALQERVEKILALLHDRQEGMFTWHMLLNEALKDLHDLLCPLFYTKKD